MKTQHKFAKVYNPTTQTVTEIPKAELAPGMILANYQGVGQVWVSQEQVNLQNPFKHASLPKDFLKVAEVVYDGFAVNDGRRGGNLTNMPRQQWLDGFRCDTHPYRELAIWGNILSFYNFARKRHGVGKSLEWLVDLYRVSLFIYTNGADNVLDTFEPRMMSRLEVQALLELHRQNATKPEEEASEIDSQSEVLSDEMREAVAEAEVIMARQPENEEDERLIYGRKAMEENVASDQPREMVALTVEFDFQSDSFQKFLELVFDVKGSVDYRRESGQN